MDDKKSSYLALALSFGFSHLFLLSPPFGDGAKHVVKGKGA